MKNSLQATGEIALVGHFYQRKARVSLVIGAQRFSVSS